MRRDMPSLLWVFAGMPLVAVMTVFAVRSYNERNAGQIEMRAITQRVVDALIERDQQALKNEPVLKDYPEVASRLMEHGAAIDARYRIVIRPKGSARARLTFPDPVTHLGTIQTQSGDLYLGFKYDGPTRRVEFIKEAWSPTPTGDKRN